MALERAATSASTVEGSSAGAYTCNEYPSLAFILPKTMRDFLLFVGLLIAWVALTRWVLPRFGVPT